MHSRSCPHHLKLDPSVRLHVENIIFIRTGQTLGQSLGTIKLYKTGQGLIGYLKVSDIDPMSHGLDTAAGQKEVLHLDGGIVCVQIQCVVEGSHCILLDFLG